MTDYSLWEVIKNGNKVLKRTVGTIEQEYQPTTAEEKQDRRNEMKARATLLMAFPNKDQLKFHSYQDEKFLMKAIEKRYGGNKESKKVQRTLLKQQYENFAALSSESMDQTFDRLQKLIGQLEIQGEVINQEDMNLKLLRSLPSEWKYHALIWRNKAEIETISLDDLYNNMKIYEPELTDDPAHEVSTTHSTTHTHHKGGNTICLDNLCDAMICAFLASQPNSPQLSQEDLEQLHPDDLEEMDLQWEMAMLTIRARRFIKRTGKKLDINGQRVGFDKSKVECFNCHKHGHFARECRFPRNQEFKGRDNNTRTIAVETPTQNALIAQDGIRVYDWSYQAEEEQPTNHALMALTSSGSSSSSDSEVDSCSKTCVKAYATLKEQYDNLSFDYKKSQFNLLSYKAGLESVEARLVHYKKNEAVFEESIKGLGYNAATATPSTVESFVNLTNKSKSDKGYQSVPPPLSGTFVPRKPDLTFIDEIVESENLDVTTVTSPSNGKTVENKGVSNTIESNSVRMDNNSASIIEDWISDDESEIDYTIGPIIEKIKTVKTVRETDAPKQNPRGNQRNWNNHMPGKLSTANAAVNIVRSVNIANTKAVNTARPFNTAALKKITNHPISITHAFKRGYSQSSRPFNIHFTNKNNIIKTNVNTARVKLTTARVREQGERREKNGIVGTKDNTVAGPKDRERDTGMKPTEVDENEASATSGKDDKATRIPDTSFTKFHKDHPEDQVIGSLKTPVQTRHMTKINAEHGLISSVYQLRRTNHKDFQNCLFACFLSQKEPKKVLQALEDPSWVEAMQNELLRFKLLNVWTLVDLPRDKWAIGTKWVFRNKKDERGIVVKNKARLVAQGHTQEEGIDYDEVFVPVARIEAIRLFPAYASFKDFIVYQMDVKSAFLYGKIEEEVYVCQPPGFEDPHFPNKVYKVKKALYGLHQAPRAWYETLSTYLLDNGFHRGQIDKTLFIRRHKDDILLVQVYVDDIIFGSTKKEMSIEFEKLMHDKFQMSSMGELSFFLGLQVKQKSVEIFISQDKYVAEILKKSVNGSLIGSLDSDYAGASLDMKSTTGGCQFLGKRLISWQCKKQTIVANSTTEAEYVAAANCRG
ncbi:putative ribonuclease H-like domain-containing protein [Tanacetum coccineum]